MHDSLQTTAQSTSPRQSDKQLHSLACIVTLPAIAITLQDETPTNSGFAKQIRSWLATTKDLGEAPCVLLLAAVTEHAQFPLRGSEAGKTKSQLQTGVVELANSKLSLLVDRQVAEVPKTQIVGMKLPFVSLSASAAELTDQTHASNFLSANLKELCYWLLAKCSHAPNIAPRGKMPEDESNKLVREFRDSIAKILRSGENPSDLDTHVVSSVDLKHEFFAEIGRLLNPIVNELIATHPQESAEDKQALAQTLNSSCRDIGLAIRCPNSGNPSILFVDTRASEPNSKSRFGFKSRQEDGGRKRTASTTQLNEIELIEDTLRREGLVDWVSRQKKESKNNRAR